MRNTNELFILAPAFAGLTREFLTAEKDRLLAADVFRLPYPRVDIQVAARIPKELQIPPGTPHHVMEEFMAGKTAYLQFPTEPTNLACRFIGVRQTADSFDCDDMHVEVFAPEYHPHIVTGCLMRGSGPHPIANAIDSIATTLVILLATKNNVVREVREHKLAKLGIGHGLKAYPRVTTLSLPPERSLTIVREPTGVERAPHRRRGHIRNQRYGPGLSFVRQIWVEDCIIHADRSPIQQRAAYNVGGHHEPH